MIIKAKTKTKQNPQHCDLAALVISEFLTTPLIPPCSQVPVWSPGRKVSLWEPTPPDSICPPPPPPGSQAPVSAQSSGFLPKLCTPQFQPPLPLGLLLSPNWQVFPEKQPVSSCSLFLLFLTLAGLRLQGSLVYSFLHAWNSDSHGNWS